MQLSLQSLARNADHDCVGVRWMLARAALATATTIVWIAASGLTSSAAQAQSSTPMSIGDAARLAAARGAAPVIAREQAAQADSRVAQRRAALLPSLTSTSQITARTMNSATLGLNASLPGGGALFDPRGEVLGPIRNVDSRTLLAQRLFDAPSVLLWRAARTDAAASRYAVEAASDGAAERGATAYLGVVRAAARMAARTADSSLASELLTIARQQVDAGIGIALDVTRAEAHLAESRARLIETRSERDRSLLTLRHELALSIDATLNLPVGLDEPDSAWIELKADDVIAGALSRRADYLQLLTQRVSAATTTRAARVERLPSVSVFAEQGTAGRTVSRQLATYSYGVQVQMPVFDGFHRSARVTESAARQREIDTQVLDARRRIETDVRSALLTLASTREEVAAARARQRLAEQEVAQARERFRSGVSGSADVINASIGLNGARDLVIDALTRYQVARVTLASAQGAMHTLP